VQPGGPQHLQQPGGAQPGVQQPGFRQGLRPGLAIRPGLRLPSQKGGKPPPKQRPPN
jgi:hypothetical protein